MLYQFEIFIKASKFEIPVILLDIHKYLENGISLNDVKRVSGPHSAPVCPFLRKWPFSDLWPLSSHLSSRSPFRYSVLISTADCDGMGNPGALWLHGAIYSLLSGFQNNSSGSFLVVLPLFPGGCSPQGAAPYFSFIIQPHCRARVFFSCFVTKFLFSRVGWLLMSNTMY